MKHVNTVLFFVILILSITIFCGCECQHEWSEATCETPQTCILCEEVSGTALGHKWREATCVSPKVCARCGIEVGSSLGHDWTEATCLKPKTCTNCGLTSGDIGDHHGEWDYQPYTQWDIELGYQDCSQYCIYCNEEIDYDFIYITSFCEEGDFIFSPSTLSNRFDLCCNKLGVLETSDKNAPFVTSTGITSSFSDRKDTLELFTTATISGKPYKFTFDDASFELYDVDIYENGNVKSKVRKDEGGLINEIRFIVNKNLDEGFGMMKALIMACDPQLDANTADYWMAKLGIFTINPTVQSIFSHALEQDVYEYNGIYYSIEIVDETYVFTVTSYPR